MTTTGSRSRTLHKYAVVCVDWTCPRYAGRAFSARQKGAERSNISGLSSLPAGIARDSFRCALDVGTALGTRRPGGSYTLERFKSRLRCCLMPSYYRWSGYQW